MKTYKCKVCKMEYKDKKIAKLCEDFCKKNHACNTSLIKLAINIK